MNKQLSFLSLILCVLSAPLLAQAEIYKHVDAQGNVTYSNVKIKGAKKLELEPADTNFGGDNNETSRASRPAANKTATPSSFPKVDTATQNQRDSKRKDILQSELDAEKQALIQAKQAYAEGESNPEVFKGAGGKTFRNVAKYEEKMKALQANVDAHQRNVDLLTKEINAGN